MAEAPQSDTTVATSAPGPRGDQLQYLLPTPPGVIPEYDYIALIQSLSLDDAAGRTTSGSSDPSPYQLPPDLTQDKRRWYHAQLISSSGCVDIVKRGFLDSKGEAKHMYKQIQRLRQQLKAGAQGEARVLFVDEFSREFLQILGAAIDLDPTFLWRHYNKDLDSDRYISEMATLRRKYFSLVTAQKRRRAGTDVKQEPSISSIDENRSVHMRYGLQDMWGDWIDEMDAVSSHISCYSFSANCCRLPSNRHLMVIQCKR